MDTTQRGIAAILFDLGDTIMQEETEQRDVDGTTLQAELTPGAIETLRSLRGQGYRLGLVADTRPGTYKNVLSQHGIYELFDSFAISEELGRLKPDAAMFEKALSDLGIGAGEKHRVLMVGNNLTRDVAGANRAGLLSVWHHWNERYPTCSANEDERPDYQITALPELLVLVKQIEWELQVGGGYFDAALVRHHAPCIRFDSREPFLPVLVGCTVVAHACPSPSFPRILRPQVGGRIIEYAIYWDWDIGHHYELEHLWVHLSATEKVTCFEGSWHGGYHRLWPQPVGQKDEGSQSIQHGAVIPAPYATPVAYSQPGKHAFTPDPSWFEPQDRFTVACAERAGNSGMIVTPLYRGILEKTPEKDELARAYLAQHAFTPSFNFDKELRLSDVPMVSWQALDQAIPRRIAAWMAALSAGKTLEELPQPS